MSVYVCVCVRLLPGGASSVGSPLLWPRTAPHFYQPPGRRLYHAGLSVVGLSLSCIPQVLLWYPCQGECWYSTGFLHPSLRPSLSQTADSFSSNVNNLVSMTTMPTASLALSFLWAGHPWAQSPSDSIVMLLKYFYDYVFFLPPDSNMCQCLHIGLSCVSDSVCFVVWVCVWSAFTPVIHLSQVWVRGQPVKQITWSHTAH